MGFPCEEDLPLGACACGPQLGCYKVELEQMREEVEARVGELKEVRGEMETLLRQHQDAMTELASKQKSLHNSELERSALEKEVRSVI